MKFEDLNKEDLDFIESRIKLKGLKSNLHIPIKHTNIALSYKLYKLSKIILAELTPEQKKLVKKYERSRDKKLEFGKFNYNSNGRAYFKLNYTEKELEIDPEIKEVLDNAGFFCPDYKEGYVYKTNDTELKRKYSLVPILEKNVKDKDRFKQLKKLFDERLGTGRKEIHKKLLLVISHNSEDIGAMSTGRDWTSCMNLVDGIYKDTPLKQVKYGGMVAYLIFDDDKNIEHPIARIAIKRLVNELDKNAYIFVSENRVYGEIDTAKNANMSEKLNQLLEKSNKITGKSSGIYNRKDEDSYSDSKINNIVKLTPKNVNEILTKYFDRNEYIDKISELIYKGKIKTKYLKRDVFEKFFNNMNGYAQYIVIFKNDIKNKKYIIQTVNKLLDSRSGTFNDNASMALNLLIKGKIKDKNLYLKVFKNANNNVINNIIKLKDTNQELYNLFLNYALRKKDVYLLQPLIEQGLINLNNDMLKLYLDKSTRSLMEILIKRKDIIENNKQYIDILINHFKDDDSDNSLYELLHTFNQYMSDEQIDKIFKIISNGYYQETMERCYDDYPKFRDNIIKYLFESKKIGTLFMLIVKHDAKFTDEQLKEMVYNGIDSKEESVLVRMIKDGIIKDNSLKNNIIDFLIERKDDYWLRELLKKGTNKDMKEKIRNYLRTRR